MGDVRSSEGEATAVSLRVVAAAAWHVIRQRRFSDFPRVVAFLQSVAEAAPDLVPFQHLSKLRLGLEAKILMNMLKEEESLGKIYHAVDIYFPENGTPPGNTTATAEELKMVQTARDRFRKLMLKLLRDFLEREIYVHEFLEREYGEAFVKSMEELFHNYLCQLEHLLPEPQFQQLLEAARRQIPYQHSEPSATILDEYFTAMGYHSGGFVEPPCTPPHPSRAPRQREDQDTPSPPPPSSPQPGRSQGADCLPCVSEREFHRQSSVNSQMAEELVPDSESEGSLSPFQGEYQGTRLRTLIPTFQEHVGDGGSPSNSSPL